LRGALFIISLARFTFIAFRKSRDILTSTRVEQKDIYRDLGMIGP